jgi:hypothetical protein
LLGNYTKLAQLEVDGKIIISYGEQKEVYEGFSYKTMGRIGLFCLISLIYIFGMPLRYFQILKQMNNMEKRGQVLQKHT